MSSRAFHCGVVNISLATQVPNGRWPSSKAGTNAQLRCAAPFSFTQCPAVITTLSFALVTAEPEQDELRPSAVVKKTRPVVRTTAPPSVHCRPGLLATAACSLPLLLPEVPRVAHGLPWDGVRDRTPRRGAGASSGCAATMRRGVQYCETDLRSDQESVADQVTGLLGSAWAAPAGMREPARASTKVESRATLRCIRTS